MFGLFLLCPLFTIADRTTVKNGLPRKLARRQLLQRLSVHDFMEIQCQNDPRRYSYYYALCSEDTRLCLGFIM